MRNEAKVPIKLKGKIEMVVGDVTNAEQVSNAIRNRDAVVVVLGTRNDLSKYYTLYKLLNFRLNFRYKNLIFLGPTTVLSQGMKNIIDAMKANNVKIVSVCLSGNYFV